MRYELWARIGREWRRVYATNHYGWAKTKAKWKYGCYKTSLVDNEKGIITIPIAR